MKFLLLWLALPVFSTGVVPVGPGDLQGAEEEAESTRREARAAARIERRCPRPERPSAAPARSMFTPPIPTIPGFLEDPGPVLSRFHLRSPSA